MSRSRWAAVGAAVAVSVGGGGLLTASAAPSPSGEASSTVPIVPCRFLDTRSSTGERTSPLGADETVTLLAFGAHGGCTIPDAATALVANVTTVNQSNSGYLTVFPADADRPTISVLNWSANDGAIGNEVTTKLSAAGSFSVYNFAGTADVVIDVVAYLVPASSGTGPNGNTGDVGQTGAVGPQGAPGIQGNPGAAGADAGTKFKMSFANPAGGSVTGQFFVASDWALTALCLNYGVNNQEVYIGVVVNGAPITVATNSPYTSTYASTTSYVAGGSANDFAVIEAGGRILGFSIVRYTLNDTCVVTGTVTDLTADTSTLFYDAP